MNSTAPQPSRRRFLAQLAAVPVVATLKLPANAQASPRANGRNWGEVVGYQIDDLIHRSKLAILPLGSVEFHGPSGPALADAMLAEGITARLAERLPAAVLPVVSYAQCPANTAGFHGSISVRPEVMTMLYSDILRGIVGNGFQKVLVLNAHSGNVGPARAAVAEVTQQHASTQMILVNWWETLTPEVLGRLHLFTSGNGGHGHGGPLELSATAVFAPNSVEPGRAPDLPATEGVGREFPYYMDKSGAPEWQAYSGKLSEISRDKGEKLVQVVVNRIHDVVANWLEHDMTPGNW